MDDREKQANDADAADNDIQSSFDAVIRAKRMVPRAMGILDEGLGKELSIFEQEMKELVECDKFVAKVS